MIVPANDEAVVDVGVSVSVWPLSTTDVVFDASSESDAELVIGVEHETSSLSVHGAADAAECDAARIGNGIRDPERQRAGFDISRARISLDRVEGDVAAAALSLPLSSLSREPDSVGPIPISEPSLMTPVKSPLVL